MTIINIPESGEVEFTLKIKQKVDNSLIGDNVYEIGEKTTFRKAGSQHEVSYLEIKGSDEDLAEMAYEQLGIKR